MLIRKAERKKAKLRLGLAGPSGAGKTYSALKLAFGLGGKIGLIDTEHGSGDLYAHLGDYDIIPLEAPYTVAKYLEAIKTFEDADYNTIIIDSLTHAWSGDGGLLDKQGKIADKGGNSYAAWRNVTPEHNSLVDAMLQSHCHIVATMRSKTEYVLETNDKGKQVPKKVGMAPIQRDGMEYEFTVFLDIAVSHTATTSKDRTGLFDGSFFKISEDTGVTLLQWLDAGVDAPAVEVIGLAEKGPDDGVDSSEKKKTITPTTGAWESLDDKTRSRLTDMAIVVKEYVADGDFEGAMKCIDDAALEADHKVALWSRFDSKARSAMKRAKQEMALKAGVATQA